MLDNLISDFSIIDIIEETGDFMCIFDDEDEQDAEDSMLCGDRIDNCDLLCDTDDDEEEQIVCDDDIDEE